MKKQIIGICPVCTEDFDVIKLKYGQCETKISSSFKLTTYTTK